MNNIIVIILMIFNTLFAVSLICLPYIYISVEIYCPEKKFYICLIRCGLYYHGACYNIEQECVIGSTVADGNVTNLQTYLSDLRSWACYLM